MANDVIDFMKENGHSQVSIIGHSMGGKVAMTLGLTHTSFVEKLIIVDIAPTNNPISFEINQYFQYFKEIEQQNMSIQQANEYLSRFIDNDSIKMFLLTNYKKMNQKYQFRVNLEALQNSLPHLGTFGASKGNIYRSKTLFIRGSKSNYVPDSVLPTIKSFFPASAVKTLPTGHWVHSEQPKDFIQHCIEFLE
jgi:pimeloyl-ACP methyl ester carboxylesterase